MRKMIATALALAAFGYAAAGQGQDAKKTLNPQNPQKTQNGWKRGEELNAIAEDAKKRGLKSCVPTLNRLTNQLLGNSRFGAQPVASASEAKDRLYNVVISRVLEGGITQLISLSLSPDAKCSATYDIYTVWPAACDQVAARNFPSYQRGTPMSGNAVLLQENPYRQVYLVPLGNGCLSMRKDTVYPSGAGS